MFLLLAIIIPLLVYYIIKRKRQYDHIWKHLELIPSPYSIPILGNIYKLHTQESLFIRGRDLCKQFWPIYAMWTLETPIVIILHPDDIELVVSNIKHNEKNFIYNFVQAWLGTGLLTSRGAKWHNRRKILTPAFHFSILKEFVDVLIRETDVLVEDLKKMCDAPYVNVMKPVTEFTLNSIGETSLGVSLREDPKSLQYKKAVCDFGEYITYRATRPWLYLPFIYNRSPLYKKVTKATNVLHEFSANVVNERKKTFDQGISYSERKKLALLDLMLKARSEGADIDDSGIKEELDTFIFEGHDTTAVSLSFTLMALANEPKIQEQLHQELISIIGESKTPFQELGKLKYMERCIKESLRLYPSVPIIGRVTGEEIKTKTGYTIPKGCNINIHIFDMHRHPEVWENPDQFDPDRFLPDNCNKRHPFAYLPFSAGSRNCIGQKFAILELKIALCGIVKNFKLEPVTKPEDIIYKSDLVLRPSNELRVKFVRRS